MKFLQFTTGSMAKFGIEIRKWFIEEKHRGIPYQRPSERDALLLAAGHLAGTAFEEFLDIELAGGLHDSPLAFRSRDLAKFQGELEVSSRGLVGIERVILEDHGDVAVFGLHGVDHSVADSDGSRGDVLKPGDHSEQRAFSAAGRAH